MKYKPVKILDEQTAKKIAAGEVIERPASVVRELLDNALDAEATRISVEIFDGGIASIKVVDNGFGMSEADLAICTETHSTSKIANVEDLLSVTSLGFRGEALASIKAVSDLEITTTQEGPLAYHYFNGSIIKTSMNVGTSVSVKNLFNNFPARKKFLKLPATEARMCRQVFVEKALANPNVEMTFKSNDKVVLQLRKAENYRDRMLDALNIKEPAEVFFEIYAKGENFSATVVLGLPELAKTNRQFMYIFANKRRIDEYGFIQALDYGAEPFFPNGTHPIALAFLDVAPETIDFNIHPAKKEARFSNFRDIHHILSSSVSRFYKTHTIATLKKGFDKDEKQKEVLEFETSETETKEQYENFEKRFIYERGLQNATQNADYSERKFFNSFARNSEYFSQYSPANDRDTKNDKFIDKFTVADASIRYQRESPSYRPHRPVDLPQASFRFLGQVAGTFIAVEKNNTLYFIDQHAAHERILFEKLKETSKQKQELLVPYRVETESEEEENALTKMQTRLNEEGFTLESVGDNVWIISAVPAFWVGTEAQLSADIKKATAERTDLLNELLALSACRAACKDGDILSPEVAFDLAQKTFALPEPLCPHGRPLWVAITRDELFKRIKRT